MSTFPCVKPPQFSITTSDRPPIHSLPYKDESHGVRGRARESKNKPLGYSLSLWAGHYK